MIINIYKPLGKTPLEAINILKQKYPQYADIKMGYAGRLDPLAEGVLLVLGGEDTLKRQKEYMELDKEYEADILFGVSTDTYDILGMPSLEGFAKPFFKVPESPRSSGSALLRSQRKTPNGDQAFALPRATLKKVWLRRVLKEIKGEYTFTLPPYSSYRIDGKPLFWWARNNKLDEIEIPQKTVKIYKIKLIDVYDMEAEELGELINERVDMVKGDFRQGEIKKAWQGLSSPAWRGQSLPVAKIKVKCSSGTYIRSIADDMGKRLGTGAVLVGLKRTRAGEYTIEKSIRMTDD